VHNLEVAGASPAPATRESANPPKGGFVRVAGAGFGKRSGNRSLEQAPAEEGLGNRDLPAAGRGSPDGGRGFVSVVESSERSER